MGSRFLIMCIMCFAVLSFATSVAAQDKAGELSEGTYSPPGATRDSQRDEEKPSVIEQAFKSKMFSLESMQKSREPIYISARRQEYRGETKEIIYSGDVVITRGRMRLRANRIVYNTITSIGSMEGDVELTIDLDFISADRGTMNFVSKEVHLEMCRGVIEPSLFFECDVLERLYPEPVTERGRYYFKNIVFTPCNQLIPHWSVKAHEVYATAEHYMHLYGSSFLVHNVPILWFPYWFYPIKTKRSTGFLVPGFGYSSRDGFRVKNEFFLVLADNADMTLTHDFKESYRNEGKIEFRYALAPLSLGSFTARYIHEKKDPFTKDEIPEDERDIYLFHGYQIHQFPAEINWRMNVDYQNNPRISSVYGETFSNQTSSFTNSWAGLTRNWSWALFSLDGSYFESSVLYPNVKNTLQRLPSFWMTVPNKRIGTSGFSWSMVSQYTNIIRYDTYTLKDDQSGSDGSDESTYEQSFHFDVERIHIQPRIRYTFPKSRTWYQITAQADAWYTQWNDRRRFFDAELAAQYPWNTYWPTFRYVYFLEDRFKQVKESFWARTYSAGEGIVREGYQASLDFEGPVFYRIFDVSGLSTSATRFKHRFWPGLTFGYSPVINQELVIFNDPTIDYLAPASGVTWYFKSDLTGRFQDAFSENGTIRSVANFSVFQTFDYRLDKIYGNRYDRYEEYLEDDSRNVPMPDRIYYPWSNIFARIEVAPSERLWLLGTAAYDPYWDEVQRINLDLSLMMKRFYLRAGWGKDAGRITDTNTTDGKPISWDNIEYVYGTLGGQISGHWAGMIKAHYDYRYNLFHHVNAAIVFDAQCWGATLSFFGRQYNDQSLYTNRAANELIAAKDEYNISFAIHFKHLGQIGGYSMIDGYDLAP